MKMSSAAMLCTLVVLALHSETTLAGVPRGRGRYSYGGYGGYGGYPGYGGGIGIHRPPNVPKPIPIVPKPILNKKCGIPQCPDGGSVIKHSCKCINKYESLCPEYHELSILTGYGKQKECICQQVTLPKCPKTHVWDKDSCSCLIKEIPSCPYGTVLKKDTLCVGVKEAICPPDTKMIGCKCISKAPPVCKAGYITDDKCACVGEPTLPVCKGYGDYLDKCALNPKWCNCELALPIHHAIPKLEE